MSQLRELANEVTQELESLVDFEGLGTRAKTISALRSEVEQFGDRLGAVSAFAASAEEHDIVLRPIAGESGGQVAESLVELADRIEGETIPTLDPAEAATIRAELDRFSRSVRTQAESEWRQYRLKHRRPSIPDEFLAVFDAIQPAVTAELRDHVETCSRVESVALPRDMMIKAYKASISAIPILLGRLVGNNPEVRAFAEAVGTGGAPLDHLTDDVRAWMKERTLEDGRPLSGLFVVSLAKDAR